MTRRRFARPCSFSRRKTAPRYGFQELLDLRSLTHRFLGLAAVGGILSAKNLAHVIALTPFDASTFYLYGDQGPSKGYTDYPFWATEATSD